MIFFSRPTPSWLSPGRSTSLYLPEMNCEKHAKSSLEKAAKESECGPLHSPFNCSIAADNFFWSAPVAFRRVALETPKWTSRDSNRHRQSVSAGKTNTIPTEPSGRLFNCRRQTTKTGNQAKPKTQTTKNHKHKQNKQKNSTTNKTGQSRK